jgi:hypothetical protein
MLARVVQGAKHLAVGLNDRGVGCNRVTMGRGQSPTAGRKVEAGPRVGTPRLSSSHRSCLGRRRGQEPVARVGSNEQIKIAEGKAPPQLPLGLVDLCPTTGLTNEQVKGAKDPGAGGER